MKKILVTLIWSASLIGVVDHTPENNVLLHVKNPILSGMPSLKEFKDLSTIENPFLLDDPNNIKYFGISGTNLFNLSKDLYEKTIIELDKNNTQYRIPKIIHQIWLGSPFPKRYKKWQAQIKKLHPDWEYRLWTDKDVESLKLVNTRIYKKARNYGEKSDIARYEILYRFGGVYLDCDIEGFKNLNSLHKSFNFYAGFEPFWAGSESRCFTVGNAIIASSAKHPIMKQCIKNIKKLNKETIELSYKLQTVVKTGPMMFTRSCYEVLSKATPGLINIIFPSKLFYPEEAYCRGSVIQPYFRHYWTHSWLK